MGAGRAAWPLIPLPCAKKGGPCPPRVSEGGEGRTLDASVPQLGAGGRCVESRRVARVLQRRLGTEWSL